MYVKVWVGVGVFRRELNRHAAKFLKLVTNTRYPVVSQIGGGHLLRASRTTGQSRPPRSSVANLSARIAPSCFHCEDPMIQLGGDVGGIPNGCAVWALVGEVFKLRRHTSSY